MKISWDKTNHYFVLEFSADFQSDLAAAKSAGFKTAGPPLWVWLSPKTEPLTKLKENKPASGLTITPEALERYTALKALEAANTEVKAQLDLAKKALRKEQKYQEQIAPPAEHEMEHGCDFDYNKVSDNKPVWFVPPVIPPPPTILCHVCQTPVYWNELQEPPTCLWCEFPENNV
jgi:hypothetical protein